MTTCMFAVGRQIHGKFAAIKRPGCSAALSTNVTGVSPAGRCRAEYAGILYTVDW